MGFNSALNFIFLGISIQLMACRRGFAWAQNLSLLGLSLSFTCLLGYIYQVPELAGLGSFTKMAFHGALGFLIMTATMLTLLRDYGIMKTNLRKDMGGILLRRLLPMALVLPVIVGWLWLLGQRQGYFGSELGTVLIITPLIIFSFIALWSAARILNQIDHAHQKLKVDFRQKQIQLRLTLINAIDHFLIQDPEIHQAIPEILEITCRHLGWKYTAFWSVTKNENNLKFEKDWSADLYTFSDFKKVTPSSIIDYGSDLPGKVWKENQASWIPDVTETTNFLRADAALQCGLHGGFVSRYLLRAKFTR